MFTCERTRQELLLKEILLKIRLKELLLKRSRKQRLQQPLSSTALAWPNRFAPLTASRELRHFTKAQVLQKNGLSSTQTKVSKKAIFGEICTSRTHWGLLSVAVGCVQLRR